MKCYNCGKEVVGVICECGFQTACKRCETNFSSEDEISEDGYCEDCLDDLYHEGQDD